MMMCLHVYRRLATNSCEHLIHSFHLTIAIILQPLLNRQQYLSLYHVELTPNLTIVTTRDFYLAQISHFLQ